MGRKTIVIGGGAIGLSVAYHLASQPERSHADEILLLERNQLTSGTSWHAAGIVGPLRASANMTELAMYALQLFPQLKEQTGLETGYRRTGGYWLAQVPERMDELRRTAAIGQHYGLLVDEFTSDELLKLLPWLQLAKHSGGIRVAEDANVNPVDLCMAYASAARRLGVEIREQVEVAEIQTAGSRVKGCRLTDGSIIKADHVALCAGAWSRPLAAAAGLALPLQAVEHMYVVTEPVPGIPEPFPVIRDLDSGIYIKGDVGGKLVIGGFEPDAKCWDAFTDNSSRPFLELAEDWDQFMPFMNAALALMPQLESVGIQHFMNGPESFTADTRPLVGQAPDIDGLFVAAGMNSVGVMSSAGIGRLLAKWMQDGTAPGDCWEVDVARADPASATNSHLQQRMQESVADLFKLHWPFKQPAAGRGLRQSVLHSKWQQQGAVFGLTAGWERGLWYAQQNTEKNLPYSVGPQPWQHIATREATNMEHGSALLDLSPFSKFDLHGPDVVSYLQRLTCAQVDINIGSVVYAPLLNSDGGIEADVTITREGATQYRITSGAATRWRDMAWLRRSITGKDVTITDVTELEAVIGVAGNGSRELLASLLPGFDDAISKGFAFSSFANIPFNDSTTLRITRLCFAGELGWEIGIPVESDDEVAARVFELLIEAGAKPMGHYALDSCRIEKGFFHWGHDLGPTLSPLQAGLDFTIDWSKSFTGKEALARQRDLGVTSRLCLLQVEGEPLLLHDEPILESGKVVGLTTSGTKGVRTGLSLAIGLIEVDAGESKADTSARQFRIAVAGREYPAQVLTKPPFDPTAERMRS